MITKEILGHKCWRDATSGQPAVPALPQHVQTDLTQWVSVRRSGQGQALSPDPIDTNPLFMMEVHIVNIQKENPTYPKAKG